ncbi:MAG: nitroreductase family protein [Candidatus Omnitrophica bacterium]|nr:nitroreductase family protein [Candidatus Omnitrophota bacterium]
MLLEVIRSRRSIRNYQDRPVEEEKLQACFDILRYAPSACNSQPWHFVVVTDYEKRRALCDTFTGAYSFNRFADRAPVILAAVIDREKKIPFLGSMVRRVNFALIDVAIACEHILLQACALGLGGCWIGWFNERAIKKILAIPRSKKVISLLTLGYPESQPSAERERRSVAEIVSFNRWRSREDAT